METGHRGEIDKVKTILTWFKEYKLHVDKLKKKEIFGGSKTGGTDEMIQTDVVMQTGCQYVLDRNSEFQKHGEIGEVETHENRIW